MVRNRHARLFARASALAMIAVLALSSAAVAHGNSKHHKHHKHGARPAPHSLVAHRHGHSVHLSWKAGHERFDTIERSTHGKSGFVAIGKKLRVPHAGARMHAVDHNHSPSCDTWYRVKSDKGAYTAPVRVAKCHKHHHPPKNTTTTLPKTTTTTKPTTTTTTLPPTTTTTTIPAGDAGNSPTRWWRGYGSIRADAGMLAASDDLGNVTIGALVNDVAQFGATTVGAPNAARSALAQLGTDGTVRWAVDLGAGHTLTALAVNRTTGDVYAIGTFTDPSTTALFVARYSRDGVFASSTRHPTDGASLTAAAGAVANNGDLAITGSLTGTVTIGATTLRSTTGAGPAAFVALFQPNGSLRWARAFAGTGSAAGLGVGAAPNGTVAFAGHFTGSVDFGAGTFTSSASGAAEHVFVANYSVGGIAQWARHYGSAQGARATGLAVAPNSDVVVTGTFAGTMDAGRGPLTTPTNAPEVFVARHAPNGNAIWSRRFVPTSPDAANGARARHVAVDRSGNVVLAGSILADVDFGDGPLAGAGTGVGTYDAFLAKLAPDGSSVWSARWGRAGDDAANALAFDNADNVVAVGTYATSIGNLNTTRGGNDVFVASLAP